MSSSFREAREEITGGSWLDDLARMSLSAAEAKFSAEGISEFTDQKTDKLAQFFIWAAEMGYTGTAMTEEAARLAEAFLAGWARADEQR